MQNTLETRKLFFMMYCTQCVMITNTSFYSDLSVPFPSEEEARIAHGTLSVDAEPKRGGVKKQLTVNGNMLNV